MKLKQYAYDTNSQLVREFFVDSETFKLDGESIEYIDGKVSKISNYINNLKTGTEIELTNKKIILNDYENNEIKRSRFYEKLGDKPSDRGELLEELRFDAGKLVSRLIYEPNSTNTKITEFNDGDETIYKELNNNVLFKETIIKPNSDGIKVTKIKKYDNGKLTNLIISESDEPIFYYVTQPYKLYSSKLMLSAQRFIDNNHLIVNYDDTLFTFENEISAENMVNGVIKEIYTDGKLGSYLVSYYYNSGVMDRITLIKNGVTYFASVKNDSLLEIGYFFENGLEVYDFDFKWYSYPILKTLFTKYDLFEIRKIFKNVLVGFDSELINVKVETIKKRIDIAENFYLNEAQNN